MGLFTQAAELEKNNRAFAFIQIVESRGSTPRHNASMLVDEDGNSTGTIGGGMMERLVLEQAKEALAQGQSRVFSGRMARQGEGAVGSDCGGAMKIHIAVQPRRPQLILLGAGHVNRAIAVVAAPLGFEIALMDTWKENLDHPDLPPASRKLLVESFTAGIQQLTLDDNCYVVIATNHQDREALEHTIGNPVRYLGLLASRRKIQTFRAELEKQGVDAADIAALRSPIGLDIGAETPEEIAISVIAEILQVKSGASAVSLQSTTLAVVSK
ncbi:XdhC family protein [Candidatus Symbiopectobacterium sp. NZEC135]|uniref:XdhC family protein n=1 Tax=Candidatus Symbiopectobacterium sp. NZEC135 TaxID=2820471 RepID=UPI0022280799|nr:XdhC family protein [Candidatus Symbiopectobacterium sp. NZEC135]MCW2477635.1 XdhC family protein [Candidatus Symbiopectobacterium sp. NZEC135]